jgi:PAT family acetyl-CoA transporter-like MFS transporter 1
MSATRSNEPSYSPPSSHLVDIDNEPKDIRLDTFVIRENRKPLPIDVGAANSHHSRPVDINLAHSPSPMPRKANGASSRPSRATGSAPSSASSTADETNMSGNLLEQRRKHASLESPDSATMTANLMSRSSFTLDNAPPPTTHTEAASKGFTDLPEQDKRNFLLLVLLYFLQGIPMGLAAGSVPFLLKSHLSYGQIGVYSLASYPYSLKLLWSPIVDAVWTPRLGRRKSWILPIQTISGLGMIWLGSHVEEMMIKAGENGGAGVWNFTGWWFALVLMCATQDIAVDGMFPLSSTRYKTNTF